MKKRALNYWHVPKRSSSHQMVGAVNILMAENMDGMAWTNQRKETFNMRLGQWGFTESGHRLAPPARRTLEAMLKYVGLIFVIQKNERPMLLVSEAGKKLQDELFISRPSKRSRLRSTIKQHPEWNILPVLRDQLKKLIITNPVIKEDCSEISVFPFRAVLRLLVDKDIERLSEEELGYIVFSMRSCKEHELIKRRIQNFRSLRPSERNKELNAFKATAIGNKALVQAPTSRYFMNYCLITGLCLIKKIRGQNHLELNQSKKMEVAQYLDQYKTIDPFDFGAELDLWIEYYGDPEKLYPPVPVDFFFENADPTGLAVVYFPQGERDRMRYKFLDCDDPKQTVALFPGQTYDVECVDIQTGITMEKRTIRVDKQETVVFKRTKSMPQEWTMKKVIASIDELIKTKHLDQAYRRRVELYSEYSKQPDYERDARATLRGGRLEYLVYQFFLLLEKNQKIDSVIWNGRVGEFGLYRPALPGRTGQPDLIIGIKHIKCPIEITTIGDRRKQWAAEGASVHDHIKNFETEVKIRDQRIIGLFSAPEIHKPLKPSLENESRRIKKPIICLEIDRLIEIFQSHSRDQIVDFLEAEAQRLLFPSADKQLR